MGVSYLQQSNGIISPPILSSTHRPLSVLFRASALTRNARHGVPFRTRNVCLASSSDTLVAGKSPEIVSNEIADLKSWMHQNGLPPCKVHLKDRPSHDAKLRPIHYVAASEDLQKVSLARRFALVPLGPPLLSYRSNCKAMLTAADDAVQLVVDRPYKAGDPIVVWCGPQPNSKLLINYGFVDEDNSYDRIVIEAALNTEDPQYQDKRLVAQRNGKLSVQVFHVNVGKEREAVFDMLPYLRLGYVSDPSEMQSVISSQGPICPVSPCMEKAVLDQLADYFRTRLAGYPTTLSEDESLLADSSLDPKKRVATQLVRLEKKVLSTCLLVAVDLISQLPDHSVSPCPAPYAPILK